MKHCHEIMHKLSPEIFMKFFENYYEFSKILISQNTYVIIMSKIQIVNIKGHALLKKVFLKFRKSWTQNIFWLKKVYYKNKLNSAEFLKV